MIYTIDQRCLQTAGLDTYWIAPTAVVIGDVKLGRNASVWFNAVLRGDNEQIAVGTGSNIQDGCVLHTDMGYPLVIEDDVTLGHGVIAHGCTIRSGALIGMGAVILNGAVIGASSIIGAKALVPEGKAIPENSIVMGVPGKIVGTVSPERAERSRAGAARYVQNWQRYAAQLHQDV